MRLTLKKIKIKNDNHEIFIDLGIDLDDELTDKIHAKLVADIIAIDLEAVKKQGVDLLTFEQNLAGHIVDILFANLGENALAGRIVKVVLHEDGKYSYKEGNNFLEKRGFDYRIVVIPQNGSESEWDVFDEFYE